MIRDFVNDTDADFLLRNGGTAAQIELAYPKTKGFAERYANDLPEPNAGGVYPPPVIAAVQTWAFFGKKLTPEQSASVLPKAQARWKKTHPPEEKLAPPPKPLSEVTIRHVLLDKVRELVEADAFSNGGMVTDVFDGRAVEFDKRYGHLFPTSRGGMLTRAQIAAGYVLLDRGDSLTPTQQRRVVANAPLTLERVRGRGGK